MKLNHAYKISDGDAGGAKQRDQAHLVYHDKYGVGDSHYEREGVQDEDRFLP